MVRRQRGLGIRQITKRKAETMAYIQEGVN